MHRSGAQKSKKGRLNTGEKRRKETQNKIWIDKTKLKQEKLSGGERGRRDRVSVFPGARKREKIGSKRPVAGGGMVAIRGGQKLEKKREKKRERKWQFEIGRAGSLTIFWS